MKPPYSYFVRRCSMCVRICWYSQLKIDHNVAYDLPTFTPCCAAVQSSTDRDIKQYELKDPL